MTISFGSAYPDLTLTVNFSGSTWTDISAYVRSCDTNRPTSDETGRYSPGSATIVLDNRDGRFTPANLSGPYVAAGVSQVLPEIGVRLKATWAATDYNLFCGIVEDWQDEFPEYGYDAVTVLTVVDRLAQVAEWNGSEVAEVGGSERSGARIGRILDAAGFSASLRSLDTGDEQLQATTLEGNGLDQLHDVVDSEGGAIWYEPQVVGADGGIRFIARGTRATAARHTSAQATFSAASTGFRDPVMSSARLGILRQAAYTRIDGVMQVSGSGVPRSVVDGLYVESDAAAKALADIAVAVGSPSDNYRVRGLSCDPVNGQTWATVLALRMQDRCAVTVTPPVSGVVTTRNVFIDGIAHHIRPLQWSIDFAFQSATAWAGFTGFNVWDTGVWDTAKWAY
jgi:hypothetical protein